MTLGQRLAFHRKNHNLTQQQLGDFINVSAQAVSKWENGQSEPDIATIRKLADIYNISLDTLLSDKEECSSTTTQPVSNTTTPVTPTKKPFFQKLKSFLSKHRLATILTGVVAVLVVSTIVLINILNTHVFTPFRIEKIEQLKYGMTREEVLGILDEPHDIKKLSIAIGNEAETAMNYLNYGFFEGEIWYYTKGQIDPETAGIKELIKADTTPYTKIRVVFNTKGKLVEFYYSEAFLDGIDDYGTSTLPRKIESVVFISLPAVRENYFEEKYYLSSDTVTAKIKFTDGMYYVGEMPIETIDSTFNQNFAKCKLTHPWGGEYTFELIKERQVLYPHIYTRS